jgi:hypothetical protein
MPQQRCCCGMQRPCQARGRGAHRSSPVSSSSAALCDFWRTRPRLVCPVREIAARRPPPLPRFGSFAGAAPLPPLPSASVPAAAWHVSHQLRASTVGVSCHDLASRA